MNHDCTEQIIVARFKLKFDISILGPSNSCFKKVVMTDEKPTIDDLDPTVSANADKTDILKWEHTISKNGHHIISVTVEQTYILTDPNGMFTYEDIAEYRDPMMFSNFALPQIDSNFAELAYTLTCTKVDWFI